MTSPSTYKLGYPKLTYSTVPMASGAPFQRNPTTSDLRDTKTGGYYKIGTVWPNASTGAIWMLASITSGTTAVWTGINGAATGDVVGPASSTDNALARFDSTTGKLIKNSIGILTNAGVLTGITQMGLGITPTSVLGIKAGTATAGTAPLKFALGVNLTSAEAGAVEYNGTLLTYTDSVPTRNTLAVAPGSSTSNGLVSWSSTTGYKLLSNTPTIASGVITFPSGGGNVLTAGAGAAERKGTFTFTGGSSGAIATTAAVTGGVIAVAVNALGTVTAAQATRYLINNGVGFTITSADATDTSSGVWAIIA